MRVRQILIQFQSLSRRRFRFGYELFRVQNAITGKKRISGGKFGVGKRVIRVNGYCLLVIFDGFLRVFRPAFAPIKDSFEQ